MTDFSTREAVARNSTEWEDWRWHVKNRVSSLGDLEELLGHSLAGSDSIREAELRFPVGVTPYYLSLANTADHEDPILLQVLPSPEENHSRPDERADPFEEEALSPVPGVVHRYPDRALIVPTNYCATLCRHCFRKRSWADGFFVLGQDSLGKAVDYVRSHPEVRDVLVTGGDPLHIPLSSLRLLLEDLRSIPHVEVLRIASRVPVTLPQRIDEQLCDVLTAVRPLWFITHFNHEREVTARAGVALRQLLDRGITVQNQAVLLRGVNDSTERQIALGRALLRLGVRPYYLHVGDPVVGAGHFRVSLPEAREIVRGMFGKVSGLGIPRLVVDLPGGRGKVPVDPDFVLRRDGESIIFESPIDGGEVPYGPLET